MLKRHAFLLVVGLIALLCSFACQPTSLPTTPTATIPPSVTLTSPLPTETLDPTATATGSPTLPPERETAIVLNVIDGDTIDVAMDGQVYRVRYLGINTPERNMKSYLLAKDLNRDLVTGETVELERDVRDKDDYGRLLRHVWVGDVHVNLELIRAGLAYKMVIPPNEKYNDELAEAQREAAQAKIGLWAMPITPAP